MQSEIASIKRLKNKNERPDIILVDGGKAQLNAIKSNIINKETLILVIEKGSNRKTFTESIYSLKGQESVKQDSKVFNLLVKARDEAHRFAIKANRSAKRKAMHKSALDTISGIGPKTKEALFTKYKSINGILQAKDKEILKIPRINK